MLKTRRREMILFQACITATQSFVVDNTNVTVKERARYVQPARQAGFQGTGYYFLTTLEDAIQRNHQRSGKASIPDQGVRARLHQFEHPQYSEGFDQLYRVRSNPNTSQFVIEE